MTFSQKNFLLLFALGIFLCSFAFFRAPEDRSKRLTLYGNVDVREVDLGFQVDGLVAEMLFEEGDLVPKGAYMGSLDKRKYIDLVREAEASALSAKYAYINAQEIFQRREQALKSYAVSDEDYTNARNSKDSASAQLQEREANLAVAKTNLAYTDLFAPTQGTILTRIREPGSVVLPSEPIYTLSIESPVWVRAYVSEPELGLIFPGMEALIETDKPLGKTYKGHIGFISPVAEFTPKTVQTTTLRTELVYRIRVIADNPDHFLKQGMPVTVQLLHSDSHKALTEDKK